MQIRPFNDEVLIINLSGGNQQKSLLAKWLSAKPKVLIADEPTRGVDVGAKSKIHQDLRELANQGVGVIVISSELPEVLGLSDRIAVFREGRITAILDGKTASQEEVMKYATQ
jgi:ABC-type sugar transport system ATPase subunit